MIHGLPQSTHRALHQRIIQTHADGIQTQLRNGTADNGFSCESTLRRTKATHGMSDGLVGVVGFGFQADIGNFVRSGEVLRKQAVHRGTVAGISARIQNSASVEGQNLSLFAETHFYMGLNAMALIGTSQNFLSVKNDLCRALGQPGDQAGVDLAGMSVLAAEAAAYKGSTHTHLLRCQTQSSADHEPVGKHILRSGIDHQTVIFHIGKAGIRLHIAVILSGGLKIVFYNEITLFKCLFYIAFFVEKVCQQIGIPVQHRHGGILGIFRVADNGQALVLDLHQFCRFLGFFPGVRRDDRNGLPAETDPIIGQNWGITENIRNYIFGEIFSGEDQHIFGKGGNIKGADRAMTDLRTNKSQLKHIFHTIVASI